MPNCASDELEKKERKRLNSSSNMRRLWTSSMEESKASLSVATEEEEKHFQIGDRTEKEKETRVGEEHGNGSSEPPPTPLKVVV